METWVIYALLSMVFAGMTSVLAKYGLQNIHPDLGLGIRTAAVFVMVTAFVVSTGKTKDFGLLTGKQLLLLLASALTTTFSWVYYYRAMKEGPVSYVAAIDKASIVVTLVLSFILLKEPASPKVIIGAALVMAGLLVLIWK